MCYNRAMRDPKTSTEDRSPRPLADVRAAGSEAWAPQFEVHALTHRVTPLAGATPYVRAGDAPVVVAALLVAALGLAPVGVKGRRA